MNKKKKQIEEQCLADELSCKQCNYRGGNARQFKKHMELEHPTQYKCSDCTFTTILKFSYKRHIKYSHGNSDPFVCQKCNKSFTRKETYRLHEIQHAKNIDKIPENLKCEVCDKVFKAAGHLKRHVAKHVGSQNLMCGQCGNSFLNEANLKKHCARDHSIHCSVCQKTFPSDYLLKKHACIRLKPKPDSPPKKRKSPLGKKVPKSKKIRKPEESVVFHPSDMAPIQIETETLNATHMLMNQGYHHHNVHATAYQTYHHNQDPTYSITVNGPTGPVDVSYMHL